MPLAGHGCPSGDREQLLQSVPEEARDQGAADAGVRLGQLSEEHHRWQHQPPPPGPRGVGLQGEPQQLGGDQESKRRSVFKTERVSRVRGG